MKLKIFSAVAALLTASIAFAAEPAKQYELKVGEFDELKVTDGVNVDWRCHPDSAGLAVFTATPDVAPMLLFTPKKGRLEIQVNYDNTTGAAPALPTITVYSSSLTKVENSGDSLVRAFNPVAPARFQAKVIGNGRIAVHGIHTVEAKATILTGRGVIVLNGTADKGSYKVTGTGTIQADGLVVKDASCSLIGTGTIGCNLTGHLTLHGAGSGKVYYSGHPTEISGNGIGIRAFPIEE